MNYTRFTNEEKKQAFNMEGGDDLRSAGKEKMYCFISGLCRKDPSKIIKTPDVYAELYFPSCAGKYFGYPISDWVMAFYRYGDGKIHFDIIYRIKGANYWASGRIIVSDNFMKQLNASVYGEYDSKHIKELAVCFFFADVDICVHKDECSVIRVSRGGLELFTKRKDKSDCLTAIRFIPYERFNPVSFRNIYSKINKIFLDLAALAVKENIADVYNDEFKRITEELCADKEVTEFFNTYDLESETEL